MLNLLENLNPEQLAAVTLPDQSALILAGAGSGKTRVLTTRIAWLIQTGNVSRAASLPLLTNKAAREMLTRISAMLPISTRGMWSAPFTACATACCARTTAMPAAAALSDPRFPGSARRGEARAQGAQRRRGQIPRA